MNEQQYRLLLTLSLTLLLLLAPLAGIHRAVRRYRVKQTSRTAPGFAASMVAVDAIAGLAGFFSQEVALLAVLLAVIWLVSALASNGLVRRAQSQAQAKSQSKAPPDRATEPPGA